MNDAIFDQRSLPFVVLGLMQPIFSVGFGMWVVVLLYCVICFLNWGCSWWIEPILYLIGSLLMDIVLLSAIITVCCLLVRVVFDVVSTVVIISASVGLYSIDIVWYGWLVKNLLSMWTIWMVLRGFIGVDEMMLLVLMLNSTISIPVRYDVIAIVLMIDFSRGVDPMIDSRAIMSWSLYCRMMLLISWQLVILVINLVYS